MAARDGASPKDTTGTYCINKALSTPHQDVLSAQGVSWLNRTTVSVASIHVELKHTFAEDPKVETITFAQSAGGVIKGTSGIYHFPSTDFKHSDHVFGSVIIQAQRKPLSEIAIPFLKEGWTSDIEDSPFPNVKGAMWTYTVPDATTNHHTWSAEQVWGYAEHEIPGMGKQKRYTRRIHFVSPSVTKDVLLIYDQLDAKPAPYEGEDLSSFGST